jgi:hypothetical protein
MIHRMRPGWWNTDRERRERDNLVFETIRMLIKQDRREILLRVLKRIPRWMRVTSPRTGHNIFELCTIKGKAQLLLLIPEASPNDRYLLAIVSLAILEGHVALFDCIMPILGRRARLTSPTLPPVSAAMEALMDVRPQWLRKESATDGGERFVIACVGGCLYSDLAQSKLNSAAEDSSRLRWFLGRYADELTTESLELMYCRIVSSVGGSYRLRMAGHVVDALDARGAALPISLW